MEEHLIERKKKLQEKKIQIAALASAILSDPESNVSDIDYVNHRLLKSSSFL